MAQEIVGHVVGPMGVEHDGEAFPFHSYDGVSCFPRGCHPVSDQVQPTTRKEQLHESARIRKESVDQASPAPAMDQEPIGAAFETGYFHPLEKPVSIPISRPLLSQRNRPPFHAPPARLTHQRPFVKNPVAPGNALTPLQAKWLAAY